MKAKLKFIAGCFIALLLALPAWAIPIPDTQRVTVDGVTWAQVNLFFRLTWDEIDAQCPDGVCASGSVLGPWHMAGWTWAGPEEAAALLNYYLANAGVGSSDLLDPSDLDDSYVTYDTRRAEWIKAIASDFRYTAYDHTGGYYLSGWVAKGPGQRYLVDFQYFDPVLDLYRNRAAASSAARPDQAGFGAWFYCADDCPPLQSIVAPPVLPLVAVALAVLALGRRRRTALLIPPPGPPGRRVP